MNRIGEVKLVTSQNIGRYDMGDLQFGGKESMELNI